jgi:alpha-L-arabinofuranosidase
MVQLNGAYAWTSPMYHVNRLFSNHFEPHLLELSEPNMPMLESHAFSGRKVPALDINATRNDDGTRLILKAVNNSGKRCGAIFGIRTERKVKSVKAFDVAADALTTMYTAFLPDAVAVNERALLSAVNQIKCTLGPFCVSLLEINLE